jgi:putative phosphoribosyl transferase
MFADRAAAGRALARALVDVAGPEPLVVGLPRGGVTVAARVAEALSAELDVVVARKVRTPGAPELAMGAVAVWGGHEATVRIEHVIARARVGAAEFAQEAAAELAVARKHAAKWQRRERPALEQRTVVVVDDGLATGATMRAALAVLRAAGAGRLVAAVPVGATEEVGATGVETVCLRTPAFFRSVGAHYRDFGQVDDATVSAELAAAAGRR